MEYIVSIIVPVYNTGKYLHRCIESLIKQDCEGAEIVLIDDGSTDESALICEKYAGEHDNIVFFRQPHNMGQSAARNKGVEIASGRWIAFVDSDDWVTENYISSMLEAALKEKASIVVNPMRILAGNNGQIEIVDYMPFISTMSTEKEKVALLPYGTWQKLVRRDLLKSFPFPETIHRFEEFGTYIPIFTCARTICVVHEPTYYYFQREESVSTRDIKKEEVNCFIDAAKLIIKRSAEGFRCELDFRIVNDCLYGLAYNMVRSAFKDEEIVEEIQKLTQLVCDWEKNPYKGKLPVLKRIFLFFAYRKKITPLRVLVWARNQIKSCV